MSAADLLIELGTEELPPKALPVLSQHLEKEILLGLADVGLVHGACRSFATPRRLAVLVEQLPRYQPDHKIERRGPALNAAFDKQGAPTGAALGFARSCGVAFDALERLETDKGAWLVYRAEAPGQPTSRLLPGILERALAALPIPKRMRWGSADHQFVRPVHWLVLLHGQDVVPASVYGIKSGRQTFGHRFMGVGSITVNAPADFARQLLDDGKVMADFAGRKAQVRQLIVAAADAAGGRAIVDPALLDEVTALVEWPSAITGSFDTHFLDVPREALIASMQGHQKYFPLEDAHGKLLNQFITIANIDSPDPTVIRNGNERVIRPRLSDAAFFWNKDRAQGNVTRLVRLKDMVFERRLGTLSEKSERVAELAGKIAHDFLADPAIAQRVGLLSRCDLVSEMVGEFPELQGTMGAYYARNEGEDPAVADALGEFYWPRFAGDNIPRSNAGRAVALADKLDTLIGIFGVGSAPTGDKDPYALRRAALGSLRICIESRSYIDLRAALGMAADGHGERIGPNTADTVLDFMLDRARGYLVDRGARADVVESVLATRPASPWDLSRRTEAVEEFLKLPEATALAAANKRISNLLRKAPGFTPGGLDERRLVEGAELALFRELESASRETEALAVAGNYSAYLTRLAALEAPVNAFFDQVMVMAEDEHLRTARLQLLLSLQALFLRVADLSLIAR